MADTRKDIFLLNQPQPGVTHQQLVRNLAALFKKDGAIIEKMLAQSRSLIKKDVDAALAAKYESAITKAGGLCELRDHALEAPLAATNPEPLPVTPDPLSPEHGRAHNNDKSQRIKLALWVVLLALLGILVAVFLSPVRDAPQPQPTQSAAPKTAPTPEPDIVALSQRIFSADRRLSINVPEDWQQRNSISEGASIGAGNSTIEVYVIVMAESRADFSEDFSLSNYTDAVLSLMANIMTAAQISPDLRHYKINGLPAEQVELKGKADGIDIVYLLTTVESDKGFFHLMSWTRSSRYQANRNLMQSVAESLVIRSFPE